jgi:hypothetical protein
VTDVPDHPPDLLASFAMDSGGVCPQTVAGWLWYCDEHDAHGNGDSEDEVQAYADTHREYLADVTPDPPCEVIVWERAPHDLGGSPG